MPPRWLPLFSAVLASVPAPAPEPTYPAPRPPRLESPWSLLPTDTCTRAPRPTLHLVRLPFSLVSLAGPAPEPPRPMASPSTLLHGQSHLSAPAQARPAGYILPLPWRIISIPSWLPLTHSHLPECRQSQALLLISARNLV